MTNMLSKRFFEIKENLWNQSIYQKLFDAQTFEWKNFIQITSSSDMVLIWTLDKRFLSQKRTARMQTTLANETMNRNSKFISPVSVNMEAAIRLKKSE